MMDATLRIKNLSIALEALSRINEARDSYLQVQTLLQEEVYAFSKEKAKETQWSKRDLAKPNLTDPFADDIPF